MFYDSSICSNLKFCSYSSFVLHVLSNHIKVVHLVTQDSVAVVGIPSQVSIHAFYFLMEDLMT